MNRREKTLIIISPGFPENEADTTCLPMQQNLVRSIKENYPQTNIIVLALQYPYFKKKYTWFNTTVVSFNGRNKGGIQRLLLRRQIYSELRKIATTNEIMGILSFWCGECAAVGQAFANKHGLKHFCWVLGQDAKKANNYPDRINVNADNLLALSDFLQEEFEKNHGVRPRYVIPPGIDPEQFGTLRLQKDIDILAAGSLIPLKQYHVFIEIIAELRKNFPLLKAVLIGNGPEKEKLLALISKYGIEKNILLTGELSYPDTLKWMQRAKLFLHPSSYEGFSGVCLEALHGAAHVISFCKPMRHDIAQWHIVNSKEEMIDNAASILARPAVVYKVVTFCTIDNVAKKIVNVFESS
jgi:glycosyltransferase involved in cell wall biosynthesis